jgi:hypothetical protein
MLVFVKRRSNVVIAILVLVIVCMLYEYLHLDGCIILSSAGSLETKPETSHVVNKEHAADADNDEVRLPSNCSLLPESIVTTKPMWVASFPGSGAELFRELITSITGQPTAEGAYQGDCHDAVTCKTHWPTMSGGRFQDPMQSSSPPPSRSSSSLSSASLSKTHYGTSSILLLRNPRHALPSWYNQVYETRVGAELHSQQAPQKSWERWRGGTAAQSKSFKLEYRMEQWKDLILYWLALAENNDYYHVDLIVPYEKLVHESTGPSILQKVANVLSKEKVSTVAEAADIPCLWKYTVQEKKSMKRSSHRYEPAYTWRHQQQMLGMLDEVMDKVSHLPELVQIIKGYRQDVQHNMLIEQTQEEIPW